MWFPLSLAQCLPLAVDSVDADFAFIRSWSWIHNWKSVLEYREPLQRRGERPCDYGRHRSFERVDVSSGAVGFGRTSVSGSTVHESREAPNLCAGLGFVFAALFV